VGEKRLDHHQVHLGDSWGSGPQRPFFLVGAILHGSRKRADAYARHCAAVAARADQQYNWVLQGDDRGSTPQGAELMHYIYPATKRTRAA
jgi:hypothetical protein